MPGHEHVHARRHVFQIDFRMSFTRAVNGRSACGYQFYTRDRVLRIGTDEKSLARGIWVNGNTFRCIFHYFGRQAQLDTISCGGGATLFPDTKVEG